MEPWPWLRGLLRYRLSEEVLVASLLLRWLQKACEARRPARLSGRVRDRVVTGLPGLGPAALSHLTESLLLRH